MKHQFKKQLQKYLAWHVPVIGAATIRDDQLIRYAICRQINKYLNSDNTITQAS